MYYLVLLFIFKKDIFKCFVIVFSLSITLFSHLLYISELVGYNIYYIFSGGSCVSKVWELLVYSKEKCCHIKSKRRTCSELYQDPVKGWETAVELLGFTIDQKFVERACLGGGLFKL